ncbi:MAG: GtrA family protein [Actinomycetota bacterium]|nr:GtrA family protein [Actinomycetota bacterium]
MASLLSRAAAYRRSAHFTRLWKFASVSVISTVITQTVLFLTYHEWSLASAMECNVIATVVATLPAYYLNRTWTWGKTGKSHLWREVAPFWVIAFVGLVLSTVAVGIAAHNAGRISSSPDVRAAVVQFANFVTYGLIWVGRYLIFNKYLFGTSTQQVTAQGVAGGFFDARASAGAAAPSAIPAPVADPGVSSGPGAETDVFVPRP